MPTADIVILIIVLLSSVIGLVRGLFEELLSLLVWFAAIGLALYFSADLAGMLVNQFSDETTRSVLGFFIVFVAVLILGGVRAMAGRAAYLHDRLDRYRSLPWVSVW